LHSEESLSLPLITLASQGLFKVVTSDHDHYFLKSLNGWKMSGGPTLFYTRSPKIEVMMGEHVNTWMRK
jgi:hypothetical protein